MKSYVGGIFWLLVGIFSLIHSHRLGLGRLREPGPGLIFFLAALIILLLSVIDLAGTMIRKGKAGEGKKDEPLWSGLRWPKLLGVIIGLAIYVSLFHWLGFLFSTFLLMIFLFEVLERTRWWISALGSFITILISYGIFILWLKVPFPRGILGF